VPRALGHASAKITGPALRQIGMDYWRIPSCGYAGPGVKTGSRRVRLEMETSDFQNAVSGQAGSAAKRSDSSRLDNNQAGTSVGAPAFLVFSNPIVRPHGVHGRGQFPEKTLRLAILAG